MKTKEIRSKFTEFFRKNKHEVVESASLAPQNDPTLLFVNAGMVPFKDVFLGNEKRGYKRATSVQKCVRAGGKHNDLENVGLTARHHTFFEMLGNFSFGDYFKKEAIHYAWDFVLNELKLPRDRLYVSVYEKDDEAAEIWQKQEGVPKERVYRFGEKDNFWQMADTGPCGPCSEIFFDRGEKYGCGAKDCQVGCECDRYLEFWNLVFMQYNKDAKGKLTPLPKPSVDTGAGLERLASILQDAETNYDTDGFMDIIEKTAKLSKKEYEGDLRTSFRVIADHSRATTFLISDGVLPSNEGRGYVLRRIMRRAIRHGKKLGFTGPFLHKTCGYVVDQMAEAYPDLKNQRKFLEEAVRSEEEQFFKTLERGLALLDEEIGALKGKKLSGEVAFKLYDTYGFPIDLTRVICEERGISVDEKAFETSMAKQRAESRKNWKGSGDEAVDTLFHETLEDLKKSKSIPEFTGYTEMAGKSKCVGLFVVKDKKLQTAKSANSGEVQAIFNKTPFYGESGGQVGDRGLVKGKNFEAVVTDVQKPLSDLVVTHLKIKKGEIKVGQEYEQSVDPEYRALTARNHTATHLLHWALREVLGDHVKQAGSLVNANLLRFDFAHFKQLTPEEIGKIETLINEKIWSGDGVQKQVMKKDEAVKAGAIAFFGEKYGDEVRVISVGDYSVELCGGTHVDHSSDIGLFKIVTESSIAAGVRRITALTSKEAFKYLRNQDQYLKEAQNHLKAGSGEQVPEKVEKLLNTEKDLRKQIEKSASQGLSAKVKELVSGSKKFGETALVSTICEPHPHGIKNLREISDRVKEHAPNSVVLLGMRDDDNAKAMLLAAVGPKAGKKVSAKDIIAQIAPMIEGRGGGKPDLAQAGGTKPAQLQAALDKGVEIVSQSIS